MRRLAAVAVCVFALAACKADATVTVQMHENGSGVVRVNVVLDRAAVRAAEVGNGKLEQRVRIDDLPGAGWKVSPWTRDAHGGATLNVSKPFSRPAEVASIVREISRSNGPLRGFTASRETSTFSTHWKVDGSVDLRTPNLGVASDQQLLASLAAERVDIPQIEARLATQLKGLQVHAVAELPDGERREVLARSGDRAVLHASSDATDVNRLVMLVGGLAVALLAFLLFGLGELRARRVDRLPAPSA
jgi:hypothetical protein